MSNKSFCARIGYLMACVSLLGLTEACGTTSASASMTGMWRYYTQTPANGRAVLRRTLTLNEDSTMVLREEFQNLPTGVEAPNCITDRRFQGTWSTDPSNTSLSLAFGSGNSVVFGCDTASNNEARRDISTEGIRRYNEAESAAIQSVNVTENSLTIHTPTGDKFYQRITPNEAAATPSLGPTARPSTPSTTPNTPATTQPTPATPPSR